MMKRLAVGLIGFLAGAELKVADLRLRRRAIAWILALQVLAVLAAVWGVLLLVHRWVPFLADLESSALIFVALLFAATLTVNCPMVTLALLTETGCPRAAGSDDAGRGAGGRRRGRPAVHRRLQPGPSQPGRSPDQCADGIASATARGARLDLRGRCSSAVS